MQDGHVFLSGDFYNQSQKPKDMEDTFTDGPQILAHKVVTYKEEVLREADQTLKPQLCISSKRAHLKVSCNVEIGSHSCFIAEESTVSLLVPASFWSVQRRLVGALQTTQELLPLNSWKHQQPINFQTTEIANMKEETLEENKRIKEMYDPDELVNVLLKGLSNLNVKESPKAN